MKKLFIIGSSVEGYSLSPKMHQFWLDSLRIKGEYKAFNVAPENLELEIKRLQSEGYLGGNVTIPHKEAVMELCDEVDPLAQKIGAVNTLIFKNGKIFGSNTDYEGFVTGYFEFIAEAKSKKDSEKNILVLGAGGAARPILLASGVISNNAKIFISNRTKARAEKLAKEFNCEVVDWERKQEILPKIDLLVNATSLGMNGAEELKIDIVGLKKSAIVFDIVYKPLKTKLLEDAANRNLGTIDGLSMLIYQGRKSFEKWFEGKKVDGNLIQKTRKYLLQYL